MGKPYGEIEGFESMTDIEKARALVKQVDERNFEYLRTGVSTKRFYDVVKYFEAAYRADAGDTP